MVTQKLKVLTILAVIVGLVSFTVIGDCAYAKNHKNKSVSKPSGDKDTYKDGLTDKEEKELKTNKKEADTDHDGLSDWLETNYIGCDPNNVDSGGDGLGDGEEISDDTNPSDSTESDSDDNGVGDAEDDDNHEVASSNELYKNQKLYSN